ncbi:MAG: hypothetical protein EON95_04545 [Caulobacteraceae bacterium]|nr:hypothetical protein [Caulobacter sp.]RYF94649.1 MAG: hypothetical protein EON95_04545 [Caulobacteraceae bacterium]
MTETDEARRFDGERVMGLINYGLLFGAIFFAGVPGIVAVVLAYTQRGTAGPVLREHYRFQIQIFWIGFLLALIAGICGLWAILDVSGDLLGRGSVDGDVKFADLDLSGGMIGLLIAAGVALALMTLWSLAAPAIGFIRLATTSRPAHPALA